MSKVCADESTVASSHTCDDRFSSDFFGNESQHFEGYYSAGIFMINVKGDNEK